jgi:hypothetical protein
VLCVGYGGHQYLKKLRNIASIVTFSKWIGKPSRRDELPLFSVTMLEPFEKWEIDFVGPINPPACAELVCDTLLCNKILDPLVRSCVVKYCTVETTTCFIFENVITRFGYPKVLMSDQGTHFLNDTICVLTQEFMIHHQKSTPYHRKPMDTVESFNKILEHVLTKVCNIHMMTGINMDSSSTMGI